MTDSLNRPIKHIPINLPPPNVQSNGTIITQAKHDSERRKTSNSNASKSVNEVTR